jgi:hypothetical protein
MRGCPRPQNIRVLDHIGRDLFFIKSGKGLSHSDIEGISQFLFILDEYIGANGFQHARVSETDTL